MIYRPSLPRGYSIERESGLLLPNEARGLTRSPAQRRGRGRAHSRGRPRGKSGAEGGGAAARTDVVFFSDWRTATGTTDNAARDAAKWTGTYTTNPEVRVTAADGRDFPSTNYLRLTDAACGVWFQPSDAKYPVPGVGESLYLRFYVRNTTSLSSGPDSHGIYFSDQPLVWGPHVTGFYVDSIDSGDLEWYVSASQHANHINDRYYRAGAQTHLENGSSFRQELKITIASASTYTLEARIFDMSGSLLDGAWIGHPGYPNAGVALSTKTFTRQGSDFSSLQGLTVGLEDPQGGSGGYMEVACLAIATDDWCGAYPIAGVED